MQIDRRYRHFCPMAQALERLGERWGLLIVRDLLPGEQRFTDLLRSCGGVTPRQLTARLRQLEGDGIVKARREAGRREVWYRLTPAGQALRPALEALLLWGIQHVVRPPDHDEPVRAFHVLDGTRLALNARSERPRSAVRWVWRFPGDPHTLLFDGTAWQLSPGEDAEADVVVETTPRTWAEFVTQRRGATAGHPRMRLLGARAQVREFTNVFTGLARAT